MALDVGDWVAICTALVGGVVALVVWGDTEFLPPAFVFVGGLACGSMLATGVLAWRRA